MFEQFYCCLFQGVSVAIAFRMFCFVSCVCMFCFLEEVVTQKDEHWAGDDGLNVITSSQRNKHDTL